MGERLETDVIVIGGGITGAGVLRDLALRGIKAILVEQQDLGHGTSSRNHGLLHSGGRYAVRDEEAASECYSENLIIKKTIPGSVEHTGGLFVKLPEDDPNYVQKWLAACSKVGIPVKEIPIAEALQQEPLLNKNAEAVYHVPDGAVDVFTLVVDVVADAVTHGAKALPYHEVIDIITEQDKVKGVKVREVYTGQEKELYAQLVINAAGPWGAKVAELAGIQLKLINNKGLLAIFNHRFNKQVINRLRMPGDADIFVPSHNVTIFGTTGINVEDPNDFSLNRQELEMMLAEGKALIPSINSMRLIRAFSGSRPLYQEEFVSSDASGRNVTRGMALLDHQQRDGLDGFISITGGKLTTFRLMAEKTVDLACQKLGISAECRTAEEKVPHRKAEHAFKDITIAPAAKHKLSQWAGTKAQAIETSMKEDGSNFVVCECEQVTWAEIESVIEQGHFHLGDIRRRTRLGMGPCQGTFCSFRAAALAVEKGKTTVAAAEYAIHQAITERQKGMGVVATGETAKQLQLMNTIYRVSLGLPEEDVQHV